MEHPGHLILRVLINSKNKQLLVKESQLDKVDSLMESMFVQCYPKVDTMNNKVKSLMIKEVNKSVIIKNLEVQMGQLAQM